MRKRAGEGGGNEESCEDEGKCAEGFCLPSSPRWIEEERRL